MYYADIQFANLNREKYPMVGWLVGLRLFQGLKLTCILC